MQVIRTIQMLTLMATLTACGTPPPVNNHDVDRLATAIQALGPNVDPAEARDAARIAYSHAQNLAHAYEITDPPLVHNTKVNMGLKPRGLCWHWAEDMEARLAAEAFRTLDIHRAIANANNPLRIDHSTALISARDHAIETWIVLDPWRHGGNLFWAPLREDRKYAWRPQNEVLAEKYPLNPLVR